MSSDLKSCQTAFPAFDTFTLFLLDKAGCVNQGSVLDSANKPSFSILQIQKHEGEIGEEGKRLDLGEEGEEETTRTV